MLYKQTALIIKTTDFLEKDKLVSLLSNEKGRIDAIAKGVRSPKAKLSSKIDLFYLGKFQLAKGKNLDIITDVKLISEFPSIRENPLKTALAFYAADLVNSFFYRYDIGNEIYHDLINSIQLINDLQSKSERDLKYSLMKIKSAFEVKILDKSGFLENRIIQSSNSELVRRFKVIKFFQINEVNDCLKLKLQHEDIKALDRYLYTQITNIIEKEVKSMRYFRKLFKNTD